MGSMVSGLLGGETKSSGGSQTVNNDPWSAAQPYLKDLFKKGQVAQQKMASAVMPSKLTAGFTPEQTQSQNQMLQAASRMSSMLPGLQNASSTQLNAYDLDNNDYFQKAIQAAIQPVVQNFNRSVIPGQELNAIANSGYGSSRHGIAEGIARSDLNQQLLNTTSTMANQAYQQGMDTSQKAAAMMPQIFASMLTPSATVGEVGSQKQNMQQKLIQDQLTRWNFQNTNEMDSLQQYANLLRGTASLGGTQTSNVAPQSSSSGGGLSQLLGTAANAYALYTLMSDARLKSAIRKVADDVRGFAIYAYTIFGKDAFGVMAQEIRELFPQAVVEHPSGFLMVDYAELGRQ